MGDKLRIIFLIHTSIKWRFAGIRTDYVRCIEFLYPGRGSYLEPFWLLPNMGSSPAPPPVEFLLDLDTDWVVFLSYESFHGPLTLNLSGELWTLQGVKVNHEVMTEGGKIQILSTGVEVDFSNAETWEAPPLPEILLHAGDRAGALKTVAGLILSQNKEPGLYLVLNDLLGLEMGGLQPLPRHFERVDCLGLRQLIKTGDLNGILAALTPLLGLGAGLTPAGDDLLLGLLLSYHRWGSALRTFFRCGKAE